MVEDGEGAQALGAQVEGFAKRGKGIDNHYIQLYNYSWNMSTNKSPSKNHPRRPPLSRMLQIRRGVLGFDCVLSGSLARRMMICGKASCRCKEDPPRLHGPYHYWGHRENGKLVQRFLDPAQAEAVRKAIRDYRKLMEIVRKWERETMRAFSLT
jgi:hypothetical protein